MASATCPAAIDEAAHRAAVERDNARWTSTTALIGAATVVEVVGL